MKNIYNYLLVIITTASLITFFWFIRIFNNLKDEHMANTLKTPVEYSIQYTTPLTPSQQMTIVNCMINQFSSQCKPNSISVSVQTVYVKMTSACLTGDGLKHISDMTLQSKHQTPNEVKTIYLHLVEELLVDNNQIYPN